MGGENQPYILRRSVVADGYDKQRNQQKTFRLGEIVHHVTDMNSLVLVESTDNSPEADKEYWMMGREYLHPFDKNFEEYLLPVKPFKDRLKLLEDVELCQKLKDLNQYDCVCVLLKPHPSQGPTHSKNKKPALVKYKGPIPEIEPAGTLFGLELLDPNDGDVDIDCIGHSGFKGYFMCKPKSGLIVAANEVLPHEQLCSNTNNTKEQSRDIDWRPPFKVANSVAEQRANFEKMSQSSYLPSRSVDHCDCIDLSKQKKSTYAPASNFSKSTEDFCCGRSKLSYQRLEMDKMTSQPSRPSNLSISNRRDMCPTHEYRNGCATSPLSHELRYLSSDQLHKKDKKVDNSFAEFPSSHSSSNVIQSGKTTQVSKSNGATNNMSFGLSGSVDGCKGRTSSRPVVINNSVDKPYSTTYRDDYGSNKLSKVNNTIVANSVPSPTYSAAIHSVQSDIEGIWLAAK